MRIRTVRDEISSIWRRIVVVSQSAGTPQT
jgi:hypothetical protein